MGKRRPIDIVLLAPGTTDSVNSAEFDVREGEEVTVMIYPEASLGADTGTLKKKDPAGTFVTATDDNGSIILSATRTMEVVVGMGVYRIEIPTRTASWGVSLTRPE